jgi:hypothetical protein
MWQSWLTGPKAQVDDMGSPTFGMQIAAIVQFVVIMTLIGPVAGMTMGNGNALITNVVYQQIYGVNGVVNSTQSNWNTPLLGSLISQANSTSGFGASSGLQTFSGLAFVYGAMNLAWKSFTNFPTMLYIIFTSMGSNISFLPVSFIAICSIGIAGYVLMGDFFKVLSSWQKTDLENVGQ